MAATALFVEVFDNAPGVPVTQELKAGAESGRGLYLVAALARNWGWTPTANGKVTWAEIAT